MGHPPTQATLILLEGPIRTRLAVYKGSEEVASTIVSSGPRVSEGCMQRLCQAILGYMDAFSDIELDELLLDKLAEKERAYCEVLQDFVLVSKPPVRIRKAS